MKKSGLTSFHIKMIAVLTMLIDHIGVTLIREMVRASAGKEQEILRFIYWTVRGIGRIAFPLFIFMLIEGFFHTRNRGKYLLRLAVFCPVAEIPFDIAVNISPAAMSAGKFIEWSSQNVMFTLTIGFLCLWILYLLWPGYAALNGQAEPETDENIEKPAALSTAEYGSGRSSADLSTVSYGIWFAECIAVTFAGCYIARRFHTDYNWAGVLGIILCGLTRLLIPAVDEARKTSFIGTMLPLILQNPFEAVALVDYFAIDLYNGERGRYSLKWFFYLFYPGHLLVLGIMKYFMFR